jgi:ADP-heptose:LPS heptosyltransferase
VLTASPEERALAGAVDSACGGAAISLAGRTTIPELAHVIRRSSLVIANNALSMHLADAFRKPVVVLFSGADRVEQWKPRSAPARLLTRKTNCSPCYAADCPRNRECLDILPHEIVYEAAKLLQLQPAAGLKQSLSKETSNAATTNTHVACPR